jgi:very-short-patch-repair endonuclease
MAHMPRWRRERARSLRRNLTDAEAKLWNHIRNRQLGGYKFVRQEPIGPYFADFVCRDQLLIVELDGGQHADSHRDAVRDTHLSTNGYRIVRFWNNEVLGNTETVLELLLSELQGTPHPDRSRDPTSPRKRGEVIEEA